MTTPPTNVPDLVDVSSMLSLLGRIGCPSLVGRVARIDTSRVTFCEAPVLRVDESEDRCLTSARQTTPSRRYVW